MQCAEIAKKEDVVSLLKRVQNEGIGFLGTCNECEKRRKVEKGKEEMKVEKVEEEIMEEVNEKVNEKEIKEDNKDVMEEEHVQLEMEEERKSE